MNTINVARAMNAATTATTATMSRRAFVSAAAGAAMLGGLAAGKLAWAGEASASEKDDAAGKTGASAAADTAQSSSSDGVTGVFGGTAEGHNGPVSVSVRLEGGRIADVYVVSQTESKGVSDNAIQKLPAMIVDANSVGIDGITGATFSSNAVLNAVSDALTNAGLDPNDYQDVPEVAQADQTIQADVLVIGGGVAGLSAALKAGQEGLNVVLVEKDGVIGGNCIFSAGLIVTAGTSWEAENGVTDDSPEKYVEDLIRPESTHLTDDPKMSILMHTDAAAKVEDLRGWGLTFVDFDDKQPRIHTIAPKAGQGGNTLIKLLTNMCEQVGVTFMTDTKVTELVCDADGAVTGAKAQTAAGEITFETPAVILASGGYTSNPDMVEQYAPDYAGLPSLSGVGTTGDGLVMGIDVGGYAYGTDEGMQMFLVNNRGFDMPQVFNLSSCILVNENGQRFIDESVVYTESAKESANQPDRVVYIVFDDKARAMYAPYADYFEQGVVVTANSPEELQEALGIDGLADTIAHYNDMVAAGKDDDFGREVNFDTIEGSNYYAIEARPYIYNSYGGLRIDEECHVVREDGTTVAGLYAAGEVTGSVERQEGRNYTSGLAQGLAFGTLAAQTVKDELQA